MTLIDMRAMPVWKTSDTATSCMVETTRNHVEYRRIFPEHDSMHYDLKSDLSKNPQDHLPFFDFPERITVSMSYDPCGHSPGLHGLSIRLLEIQLDPKRRWNELAPLHHDSLFLGFDTSLVPYDMRTPAWTKLSILQVGQEDLLTWSRRLGKQYMESKVWTLSYKNHWLRTLAWLPGQPRTLVMQSTTEWGPKTIVDTFTIDIAAKRLIPGFQP